MVNEKMNKTSGQRGEFTGKLRQDRISGHKKTGYLCQIRNN